MLSFNYAQSDGNYSLKIAVTRETLFLAGEAVLLAPEFGAGRRDFQIQPKTVEQALCFAVALTLWLARYGGGYWGIHFAESVDCPNQAPKCPRIASDGSGSG
jgi:hypothetical protein